MLNLPQSGQQVLGRDLNRSELSGDAAAPTVRYPKLAQPTVWRTASALRDFGLAYVRFGSKADIPLSLSYVRFTP